MMVGRVWVYAVLAFPETTKDDDRATVRAVLMALTEEARP